MADGPVPSLRQRLLLTLTVPLLVVAGLLGAWRVWETSRMTADLFDRTLISAALAIAGDPALRDGDALTSATLALMADTAGGQIFYHVQGPDRSFVAGFATPPLVDADAQDEPITLYNGRYRGAPVRVVRLTDSVDLGWIRGDQVISVWQPMSARRAFATRLTLRTGAVLAVLTAAVGLLSWFGLRFALRPLTEIEAAIAERSPDDLTPIRRPVPVEVRGVVGTLNTLFDRVTRRISSKDEFISNAAHQLRNPIAGVVALAEAIRRQAGNGPQSERAEAMVSASRHLSRLADQLLSWERLQDRDALDRDGDPLDLTALAHEVVERAAPDLMQRGAQVTFDRGPPLPIRGDGLLLGEALQNLLDNAVRHGGGSGISIEISTEAHGHACHLRVRDDGIGLAPEDRLSAVHRFSQVRPGEGSGLGLAIVVSICRRHGGRLEIEASDRGASLVMLLPRSEPS
ncbi:MAG: sensor histidine kinase [Pseudomonadota bacterium]